MQIDSNNDKEISNLFNTAKEEIDKINQPADEKKKVIVIKLAEQLEKLITQTDTISFLIVKRLSGKVSPSFIRECLPEKYKQAIRVENAKQKKRQKEFNNLAPLPLLNQDVEIEEKEEHQKNKGYVFTDTNGMSYLQWEDDSKESPTTPADDSYPLEDKRISPSTYKSQQEEKQEQHPKKPFRFETNMTEKMVVIEESGLSYNSNNKDILPFEFSIGHIDIQNYLDAVKSNTENIIWFNGIIDLKTRVVISVNLGRLNQQNVAEEKSNSIASTTEYTI